MSEITDNRDRVKEEIRATGEQIIAEVRQSMSRLEEKADLGAEQKLTFVNAQKREAQKTADKLQKCVEAVEEVLRTGCQRRILASKSHLMETMKTVTYEVKEEKYSSTEDANIQFKRKSNTTVGTVDFSLIVHGCTISRPEKPLNGHEPFYLSVVHSFMKKPASYPTALVSCQLFMPPSTTPCPADYKVKMTSPGYYRIMFITASRGPHLLKVMLRDVEIPGNHNA